eukprot:scaffold71392_cov63-Phaeocystis_antarctica.AAC.1
MRPATLGSLLGTPLSKRLFSTGVLAQLDSFGRFCHADASCGGSSCLGLPGQSHDATQLSVVGFFKHVVSHQSAATMLPLRHDPASCPPDAAWLAPSPGLLHPAHALPFHPPCGLDAPQHSHLRMPLPSGVCSMGRRCLRASTPATTSPAPRERCRPWPHRPRAIGATCPTQTKLPNAASDKKSASTRDIRHYLHPMPHRTSIRYARDR